MKQMPPNPLRQWIYGNLFTYEFFDNKFFPDSVVLVSHPHSTSLEKHLREMEMQVSPIRNEDIYLAVMKACGVHKLNRGAIWFHANVVDQCVWVFEEAKAYPYPLSSNEAPLSTLFRRMKELPADQGGTTYVGWLSEQKKWLLLLEKGADFKGADFKISFYGSPEMCKTVASLLKQRPL